MKFGKILSGAALMLASATVMAQGPNYSYVQGGYQMLTGTDSPDGGFIEASYQIADQVYLAGGYDIFSDSFVEISRLTARGGYIHPLEENIHLYGEAGLARSQSEREYGVTYFDLSTFSYQTRTESVTTSSTDLMIEAGIRALLMPELEVRGALRRVTGDYTETYLVAEGAYHFNPQWAVVGGLSRMTDWGEYRIQVGARFAF